MRRGFTIIELLIVIVVIAILAAITIVAYNGVTRMATETAVRSEVRQNVAVIEQYKVLHNGLPSACDAAGVKAGAEKTLTCRVVPDRSGWCLSIRKNDTTFYASSTDPTVRQGTCDGYILVPGNELLGTRDFWVMKYEAKNVNGVATSEAAATPWVSISQTDAISTSAAACDGCHLISEAEWMTLAGDVLGVSSNWSGGSVGSGYIFSGHSDADPANAVVASSTDSDGYSGTNDFAGDSGTFNALAGNTQRRTLTLSNGEVVWDIAGNIVEWTQGTIAGNQQAGLASDAGYSWKQWNSGSMIWGALPAASRPSVLSSLPRLSSASSWGSSNGVGMLYSNYASTESDRAFLRGGYWSSTGGSGVLSLNTSNNASLADAIVGFRVAR